MIEQELVRGSLWKCLNPDGLEFDQDGIYTMHRDDDNAYYLEDNTGCKRYLGDSYLWPLEEFHEMFIRVV